MALKQLKRKYSMADSDLGELGDSLAIFAERDLVQMTPFGFDQPRINVIKTKITAFKAFMPDEYYVAQMMGATVAKNTAIKNMSEVAEGVVRRATTKFGKDSHQIRAYGWAGYITKKDAEKTSVARQVHQSGTDQLADLGGEGLTAAILTDLNTKMGTADAAITAKAQKVALRDQKVNERVTLGNELYGLLVDLADTGKHIWEDTNEAFYNDYVIYSSPNTQTATATIPVATIHAPSVVVNDSGDEIKVICNAGKVEIYVQEDATGEPLSGFPTQQLQEGETWEGTAADLQWTAENFRLVIKNTGTVEAVVEVKVVG